MISLVNHVDKVEDTVEDGVEQISHTETEHELISHGSQLFIPYKNSRNKPFMHFSLSTKFWMQLMHMLPATSYYSISI